MRQRKEANELTESSLSLKERIAQLNRKMEESERTLRSLLRQWLLREENARYREWHEALEKAGFTLCLNYTARLMEILEDNERIEETLFDCVFYSYQGYLTVYAHYYSMDRFTLNAFVTRDGIAFSYSCGLLDLYYRELPSEGPISKPYFLERIKAFFKKRKSYLGAAVEVTERDDAISFSYLTGSYEEFSSGVKDLFTKLAVLTDLQCNRSLPFFGIRDYETYYRLRDDYDFFLGQACMPPASEDAATCQIVGVRYAQGRQDAILRLESLLALAHAKTEEARGTEEIEEAELRRQTEELIDTTLQRFKSVSDEEFEEMKDWVFDL